MVTEPDGWRCPGCGLPYEELPLGHSWTLGTTDCGVTTPVGPAEFMHATMHGNDPK